MKFAPVKISNLSVTFLVALLLSCTVPVEPTMATAEVDTAAEKLAILRMVMVNPDAASQLSKYGRQGYRWEKEQIYLGSSGPNQPSQYTEIVIHMIRDSEKKKRRQLFIYLEWDKSSHTITEIRTRAR